MASEKLFETKVKRWLESEGVYPLGRGLSTMPVAPCGYYEKRWGGGYSKSGLPDLHMTVNFISIDVELKASRGILSELQKHNILQINASQSLAFALYPESFNDFKIFIQEVKRCNTVTVALNALKDANTLTNCSTSKNSKP